MGNILRIPNPGQPVDATYMFELANAINKLSTMISTSPTTQITSIDTPTAGKQSIKTSEARIIGGYKEVVSSSVSAGAVVPWTYEFPADFKYPPIATATPINVAGSDSGSSVSVMIKSIGPNSVSGTVLFAGSGSLTVGLNIIIIGIPN
jgi:hypothetical protein